MVITVLEFVYRLIEKIFVICLNYLTNNSGGGYQMHILNFNTNLIGLEVLSICAVFQIISLHEFSFIFFD